MHGNSIIPTEQEHDDHYGDRCSQCDCRLARPSGRTETGDWLCYACDLHYEEPKINPTMENSDEIKPMAEWEGRTHGSQEWEDIWPEHDGQMSYGADITYVEIRRKGSDALT